MKQLYKWLILPDDVKVTGEIKAKLDRYLSGGGKLLLSGRSGTDENGNPAQPVKNKPPKDPDEFFNKLLVELKKFVKKCVKHDKNKRVNFSKDGYFYNTKNGQNVHLLNGENYQSGKN